MTVVYDAGVLVAAARNNRYVWADHRVRLEEGLLPATTAPVVAQVSRSPRQVQLHRFLRGCVVVPFAADEAHEIGRLLGRCALSDVVDAHVVTTAQRRSASAILTSDPQDLRSLSAQLTKPVIVQGI
jgi:predicted nucleic acid-binding protein